MTEPTTTPPPSPWPHRMAWVLACATFPLLWVGGLITTTDAGMAVPDWPGTYGYNMFLYPWQTWLFGPWDLFIEHGHRLLASGVGMLTIALLVVCLRCGASRGVTTLTAVALALVIGQGVLGGLRVVLNERYLAMAHGITGPVFFGVTVALVVATGAAAVTGAGGRRPWSAWALPALLLCQLMLGATLRHAPEEGSFLTFASHVRYHLIVATVVAVTVFALAVRSWTRPAPPNRRRLAAAMAGLVTLQLALGFGAWVVKYRLPGWAQRLAEGDAWEGLTRAVTMTASTAGGWAETHTVTAHSAVGSLLLGLSVAVALAARRPAPDPTAAPPTP